MRIYCVDEHHLTHTCPADPAPHSFDIRRTIVHVTDPEPCLAPVTLDGGGPTVVVDCGTWRPHDQQCDHCRTVITVGTVTYEHLGYQGPAHLAPTPAEAVA